MNEGEDGSNNRSCSPTYPRFRLCEIAYYDVITTEVNIRIKKWFSWTWVVSTAWWTILLWNS